MFQNGDDQPNFLTFDGIDGVMLIIMPCRIENELSPTTALLLDPAKRGTLAALRAHATRTRKALDGATGNAQHELNERLADFEKRIREIEGSAQLEQGRNRAQGRHGHRHQEGRAGH